MAHVSADDFRVPGEKRAFWIATALLVLLLIPLLPVWPVIAVVIGGTAFWTWISQGAHLGNGVKVSEKQFPEIHAICKKAAARLSMSMPYVFIVQDKSLGAFAKGFLGKKCVTLHSSLVQEMTPEELAFIIGHEFAHIKCNHTNLLVLTSAQGANSIPGLSYALHLLYQFWSRKGEYTCDRGGLLACREEAAAVSALAKLAVGTELFKQLNVEEFLGQHMDIEQDDVAKLSEMLGTHPFLLRRIKAIVDFHSSDLYRRLSATTA
jgi:Zn-dependent protease with chaperone function